MLTVRFAPCWLFQQLRMGQIHRYSIEKRYVRKDLVQNRGQLNVEFGDQQRMEIEFTTRDLPSPLP